MAPQRIEISVNHQGSRFTAPIRHDLSHRSHRTSCAPACLSRYIFVHILYPTEKHNPEYMINVENYRPSFQTPVYRPSANQHKSGIGLPGFSVYSVKRWRRSRRHNSNKLLPVPRWTTTGAAEMLANYYGSRTRPGNLSETLQTRKIHRFGSEAYWYIKGIYHFAALKSNQIRAVPHTHVVRITIFLVMR
jgi:hypothetical protein